MSRNVIRVSVVAAAAALAVVGGPAAASADQGCTGRTASTVAPLPGPFGAIVSENAQPPGNFGQDVIRPEATAPHDACPPPPS